MSSPCLEHIDHQCAWRGADLSRDAIAFELRPHHVQALEEALAAVRAEGLGIDAVGREQFPLPALADDLAALEEEVLTGRGLVLIRGFPVEERPIEDVELLYWGLGTYFGRAVSQSVMGDRIGHVVDVSGKDPNERAYRNSLEVPLHTDSADVVGMLSLRAARSGGLSTYTSAVAVHNAILATHPEYLEPLYRGYRVHRFGEQAPGEPSVTENPIPVLSERDGHVSARIVPEYIDMAEVELGEPMPALDRAALERFLETAAREDLRFDVMLEPGDITFINNYTVLHSRTAFHDHEAPERRRHLLRLWLATDHHRPVDEALARHADDGIEPMADRESSYFDGDTARLANRGRYGEEPGG